MGVSTRLMIRVNRLNRCKVQFIPARAQNVPNDPHARTTGVTDGFYGCCTKVCDIGRPAMTKAHARTSRIGVQISVLTQQTALNRSDRIDVDVPCIKCGYNLRTLY